MMEVESEQRGFRARMAMRRRDFMRIIGGAAAGWTMVAGARQGDPVRRICVLIAGGENYPLVTPQVSAFTQALADLGWTDGHNLRMDVRLGRGDINRIRALAQESVGLQPDIIVTNGIAATAALQRETRTIPVVFAGGSDPIPTGIVP